MIPINFFLTDIPPLKQFTHQFETVYNVCYVSHFKAL